MKDKREKYRKVIRQSISNELNIQEVRSPKGEEEKTENNILKKYG